MKRDWRAYARKIAVAPSQERELKQKIKLFLGTIIIVAPSQERELKLGTAYTVREATRRSLTGA